MDPLYTSPCRDQPNSTRCVEMVKSATFGSFRVLSLTIICALLNHYVFRPVHLGGLYGAKFLSLPREDQKRVSVLHVGILIKIFAFISLAIPAYRIGIEHGSWSDPGWPSGLTLGDMGTYSAAAFAALSLFDLVYSDNVRIIYVLHHLGTVVWLHSVWATFLSLPTTAARTEQFGLICEVSLSWVLLSSLGSTVSRLIYLLRQFGPTAHPYLHWAFFGGFVLYAVLMTLEAGLIVSLINKHLDRLPQMLPPLLALFQLLFTATKLKTTSRILTAYRLQKAGSRDQAQQQIKTASCQ